MSPSAELLDDVEALDAGDRHGMLLAVASSAARYSGVSTRLMSLPASSRRHFGGKP